MPQEKYELQYGPSAQAARELAYRRWRPQSPAAASPASDASSARLLAHHRWGTAPAGTTAPIPAPEAASQAGEGAPNVLIFAVLAGAALAIYAGRKNAARERAATENEENWRAWLIAGSAIAAAALLLFSEGARRNWGPVLGTGALLLAATVQV